MDDKKFKKIYLICIIVSVILVLAVSFYRRYKNTPKPVYIDGVRTEIFGVQDPLEQERLRYELLNKMKYGEKGIPYEHTLEIEKMMQEERLR